MAKKGRKARRAKEPASAGGSRAPASDVVMPAQLELGHKSPVRGAIQAFIALFLLYQIAMPLRYYLGGRGDDERFSWRMFSTVRLRKCEAHVLEVIRGQSRQVDLSQAVQIAWIGMLERGRLQVVEKLLRRRCQGEGVTEARYERTCTNTDGSEPPKLALLMDCARGTTAREDRP